MRVVNVVGARPNFVKIAPLLAEMRGRPEMVPTLVHTGQHYDGVLSERFFADLEIPRPDVNLGVGSGSHAVQTAEVMKRLEPVLMGIAADLVLVVGDVNSTLAAALTAVKLGIPVAHVEAGLRSFDRQMPEEINRRLTDAVADVLFVTEESARTNLLREGIAPERIHMVGNVMIDALQRCRSRWERSSIFERLGLDRSRSYAVLTLHRPSNVDDATVLGDLLDAVEEIGRQLPIVFPVHPRLRPRLPRGMPGAGTREPRHHVAAKGITYLDPLGYLDFIALVSQACLMLTDSGGVQEETTVLGVPCLTLRETTERPVTVTHGTNRIVGTDPARIVREALAALENPPRPDAAPPLWDGRAAERIVEILTAGQPARAATTV